MAVGLVQVDETSSTPIRSVKVPGSLADAYSVIDRLKGRSLEEELAGLRTAREKVLAVVPRAAEQGRLAEMTRISTPIGALGPQPPP